MKKTHISKASTPKELILSLLLISIHFAAYSTLLTDRVLVIRNLNSPSSIAIADDYMERRGVNAMLDIYTQDGAIINQEYMSYPYFYEEVEIPLLSYLTDHPEIDFIVLTKGMPIHFYDFPGQPYGGVCSVDSYISSLSGYANNTNSSYVKISDPNYDYDGIPYLGHAWINKFWKSESNFSHGEFGGYLVSRLDGYTIEDAMMLTTNSLLAESNLQNNIINQGEILLDAHAPFGLPDIEDQPYTLLPADYTVGDTIYITAESPFGDFNADMEVAHNLLVARSIPSQYENTFAFVGSIDSIMGYVSFGSNDGDYNAATYNALKFYPGAIGETGVSTSARTFLPTEGGQSLIVDLIAQGITGAKGYTDEPLLQAIASPSVLFDRYTRGWTMAESYYAASRLVGWMDLVIGDPICIAYAEPNVDIEEISNNATFKIYPNPVEHNINIKLKNNLPYQIFNANGKLVQKGILLNEKIDFSQLNAGIYSLIINDEKIFFRSNVIKTDK
jgi:Secretion system C-terminal sorting domain